MNDENAKKIDGIFTVNLPAVIDHDKSKARKAAVKAVLKTLPKQKRTYKIVKEVLEACIERLKDWKIGL